MESISTSEPDTCMTRMEIDDSSKQVFGFLGGGVILVLAGNLTGVRSMALCPDRICVGINVSGNHVKPTMEGDTVATYGRL